MACRISEMIIDAADPERLHIDVSPTDRSASW